MQLDNVCPTGTEQLVLLSVKVVFEEVAKVVEEEEREGLLSCTVAVDLMGWGRLRGLQLIAVEEETLEEGLPALLRKADLMPG